MGIPEVKEGVTQVMQEIKKSLIAKGLVISQLADFYAQRELKRFENKLLFDPIERVAREPLRKLRPHDRLVNPLKLIQETEGDVFPVCQVIKAVLAYGNVKNNDQIHNLKIEKGVKGILTDYCQIKDEKVINLICSEV